MNIIESTTVNNNKNVFIPISSISHIIENIDDTDNTPRNTTWLHMHNGKSLHINAEFNDISEDIEHYLNSTR